MNKLEHSWTIVIKHFLAWVASPQWDNPALCAPFITLNTSTHNVSHNTSACTSVVYQGDVMAELPDCFRRTGCGRGSWQSFKKKSITRARLSQKQVNECNDESLQDIKLCCNYREGIQAISGNNKPIQHIVYLNNIYVSQWRDEKIILVTCVISGSIKKLVSQKFPRFTTGRTNR